MKISKLFFLIVLFYTASFSQKVKDSTIANTNNYRWRIELGAGESRGIRPFTEGFYSSNSKKILGILDVNSVSLGATYTYSKLLGFKLDFAFDRFKNKDSKSLPFEVAQFRSGIQGVININNLLKYQKDDSPFKVLFHSGIIFSTLQKITSNTTPKVGSRELNGGVEVGVTPMIRIAKKVFVYFDFSSLYNFRQHYTWDGAYSKPSNNLSGQMINGTFGLTYSFGKQLKWDVEDEEIKKLKEENEALEKRVGDIETLMNDTDKDGVPDYLDSENNSVAGVAVDTRGKMVDIDRNGVPDELERYFVKTYGTPEKGADGSVVSAAQSDFLKKSINDGYITVFFASNSAKPVTQSIDGIHFVLTYLSSNPNATLDITGYADEIGDSNKNLALAAARANNVKKILVKAGISESRLSIISGGEDNSVDPNSTEARSLVRRVVFKLK